MALEVGLAESPGLIPLERMSSNSELSRNSQSGSEFPPLHPRMEETYEFRPICSEHIPAVKLMHDSLFPVKYSDRFYQSLLNGFYKTRLLFHIDTNQLVGVASYKLEKREDKASTFSFTSQIIVVGYLATFGIIPEYRRRGLGRYLLDHCAAHMVELRCASIELHVEASNSAAVNLYTSNGFQIKMRLPQHYYWDNDYHDALFLVHSLHSYFDESSQQQSIHRNNHSENRDYSYSVSVGHSHPHSISRSVEASYGSDDRRINHRHTAASPIPAIDNETVNIANDCNHNNTVNNDNNPEYITDWTEGIFPSLFAKCNVL